MNRQAPKILVIAALAGLAALVGLTAWSALERGGDSNVNLVVSGATEEVVADGVCLARDVPAATVLELHDRAHQEALASTRVNPGFYSAPVITEAEARQLMAFPVALPATLGSWSSEIVIVSQSPDRPVGGHCWIETTLTNPNVSITKVEPAETRTRLDGTTGVIPEQTETIYQGVSVRVGPLNADDGRAGGSGTGEAIQLAERTAYIHFYHDPEAPNAIGIRWDEGNNFYVVGCTLLTREECIAIAETVK